MIGLHGPTDPEWFATDANFGNAAGTADPIAAHAS